MAHETYSLLATRRKRTISKHQFGCELLTFNTSLAAAPPWIGIAVAEGSSGDVNRGFCKNQLWTAMTASKASATQTPGQTEQHGLCLLHDMYLTPLHENLIGAYRNCQDRSAMVRKVTSQLRSIGFSRKAVVSSFLMTSECLAP
jgi:hypothetical protein